MSHVVEYRGRFAPSPTGALHFGSLVAALGSYCDARHANGQWFVRIEDVDAPRARREHAAAHLRTLERYGFTWDGEVLAQSARTEIYRDALNRLIDQEAVFPCTCTRADLSRAPISSGGDAVYPGTCRQRLACDAAALPRSAWRMRVEGAPPIAFTDRLQGPQRQELRSQVGDFVVRRSDGLYAYQLAVVIDDALQGITDVVRGADLLASTARQIYVQQRLGFPTPRYLHLPVAVNVRGEKLSKQTSAAPLPLTPLPALTAAWRFLNQPAPPEPPGSVGDFWTWAVRAWSPALLPAVPTLQAPQETWPAD